MRRISMKVSERDLQQMAIALVDKDHGLHKWMTGIIGEGRYRNEGAHAILTYLLRCLEEEE